MLSILTKHRERRGTNMKLYNLICKGLCFSQGPALVVIPTIWHIRTVYRHTQILLHLCLRLFKLSKIDIQIASDCRIKRYQEDSRGSLAFSFRSFSPCMPCMPCMPLDHQARTPGSPSAWHGLHSASSAPKPARSGNPSGSWDQDSKVRFLGSKLLCTILIILHNDVCYISYI